jgi:hypothetical protein
MAVQDTSIIFKRVAAPLDEEFWIQEVEGAEHVLNEMGLGHSAPFGRWMGGSLRGRL